MSTSCYGCSSCCAVGGKAFGRLKQEQEQQLDEINKVCVREFLLSLVLMYGTMNKLPLANTTLSGESYDRALL